MSKVPSFRLDQITIATLPESEKLKITKIAEKLVEMNRKYTEVEYTLQTERAAHQEEINRIHQTIEGQVSIIEDRMRLKDEAIATLETKEHMLSSMLALYQAKLKNMVDIYRLSSDTETYNKKKIAQLEADLQHFQVVVNNQKKIIDSFESTKEQLEEKMKSMESRHGKRVKSLEDMLSEEMDRKLVAEKSNMELSSQNLLLKSQVQQLQYQLQLSQHGVSSSINVSEGRALRPTNEYAAMFQSYDSTTSLRPLSQDSILGRSMEKEVKPQIVDYSPSRRVFDAKDRPTTEQTRSQTDIPTFPSIPSEAVLSQSEALSSSDRTKPTTADDPPIIPSSHPTASSASLVSGIALEQSNITFEGTTPPRKRYSLLSQITPDRRIIPQHDHNHNENKSRDHINTDSKVTHQAIHNNTVDESPAVARTAVKSKKKKKKANSGSFLAPIDLTQDALSLSESQQLNSNNGKVGAATTVKCKDNAGGATAAKAKQSSPRKTVSFPTPSNQDTIVQKLTLRSSVSSNGSAHDNNKRIVPTVARSVTPNTVLVEAKVDRKNGQIRIKKQESGNLNKDMKYDPKLFDLLDVLEQREVN